MSAKQTLTKAFNVALIVASFGLVGAITAGLLSADGRPTAETSVGEKVAPTPRP